MRIFRDIHVHHIESRSTWGRGKRRADDPEEVGRGVRHSQNQLISIKILIVRD
jgi:hypothetical protein